MMRGAFFGARLCPKDQPQLVAVREALGLTTLLRLVCDTAALRSLREAKRFFHDHRADSPWMFDVEC